MVHLIFLFIFFFTSVYQCLLIQFNVMLLISHVSTGVIGLGSDWLVDLTDQH